MIMMPFGQVGAQIILMPLLSLSILCGLFLWTRVWYIQRKSLSTVPGPRWAAWTRFWIVKTLASGKSAQKFVEVNQRYGEALSLVHESFAQSTREIGTHRA
jgi:hypothetical protein